MNVQWGGEKQVCVIKEEIVLIWKVISSKVWNLLISSLNSITPAPYINMDVITESFSYQKFTAAL